MFWNDPILYGATLPYRDVPVQTPFFGQMLPQFNAPRFIPPMYGFVPPMYHPLYNLQQFPQVPQIPQIPQVPQIPQLGINPFVRPLELNQPFYGWNRPLANVCCW